MGRNKTKQNKMKGKENKKKEQNGMWINQVGAHGARAFNNKITNDLNDETNPCRGDDVLGPRWAALINKLITNYGALSSVVRAAESMSAILFCCCCCCCCCSFVSSVFHRLVLFFGGWQSWIADLIRCEKSFFFRVFLLLLFQWFDCHRLDDADFDP